MLVEMTVQLSGTRDGVEWPEPGATIDVPDDEAESLIRHGSAVAAATPDEPTKGKRA